MDKNYNVELYYGYVQGEDGIAHAFELVDANAFPNCDMVADGFAEVLDTERENPLFQWDCLRMPLPAELVARIQADAIKDYIAGKFIEPGETEKNTKVVYRYTDASNYHTRNEAVLRGVLSEEQKQLIFGCLDEGKFFVPQAVCLDMALPWEYDPQEDHPFWTLDADSFELTTKTPTVNMTVDEFVNRFVACKDDWERLGVEYTPEFDGYKDAMVEEIVEQACVRCDDAGFRKGKDKDVEMV